MMAYDSQFVICVLHNGHPVREISGTASVPFNSEYKIRLKNKHSYLRAKARVWVDGRQASNLGDFILKAGETLDLERFLDSDLDSGNKFQFVPLSDSRVNDPTDSNNGIIKVEFYREHDYVKDITITNPVKPWKPVNPKNPNGDATWQYIPTTFTSGSRGSSMGGTTNISCDVSSVNYLSTNTSSAGATVEGGFSGQQFSYGDDFQTEIFPVTLTLKIKGLSHGASPTIEPPRTTRKKVRFCSNCARRRSKMADKFCPRCGNSY